MIPDKKNIILLFPSVILYNPVLEPSRRKVPYILYFKVIKASGCITPPTNEELHIPRVFTIFVSFCDRCNVKIILQMLQSPYRAKAIYTSRISGRPTLFIFRRILEI